MIGILNYCYRFTKNIDETSRSKIRIVLYSVVFLLGLFYASIPVYVHLLYKCIIGTVLLGLIIVFSINGKMVRPKLARGVPILWLAIGLLRFVSGFTVSNEYLPLALIWLIGFPMLFLVWINRKDYYQLFFEVAKSANIALLVLIVGSLLFIPVTESQYRGITLNPNGLGQWISFGLPMIFYLYEIERRNARRGIRLLYAFEIVCIYYLCYASISRTALISIAAMTCVYGAWYVYSRRHERLIVHLKKALAFVVVAAASLALIIGVNSVIARNIPIGNKYVAMQNKSVMSIGGDIELDKQSQNTSDVMKHQFEHFDERLSGQDKGDSSANAYSSGRIGIWKQTISMLNIQGHPSREHIITARNGDVGSNVHNTVLQFAYDNGIITGVLFACLMIVSAFILIRRILYFKEGALLYVIFFCIHAGYCCTAMLASLNLPFLYMQAFAYYLTFAVLFTYDVDSGSRFLGKDAG